MWILELLKNQLSPGKELRAMLRVTLHERSVALKGSFSQNIVMENLSSVESGRVGADLCNFIGSYRDLAYICRLDSREIMHSFVHWARRNLFHAYTQKRNRKVLKTIIFLLIIIDKEKTSLSLQAISYSIRP